MRARINATRWPERETVNDDSQGVPLAILQELAEYWATHYDWAKCESKLNAPRFVAQGGDCGAAVTQAMGEQAALADSPIDLAAFAIDHGDGTGKPGLVGEVVRGHSVGDLTRDDILDNITLYWLTNTGVSAARLY